MKKTNNVEQPYLNEKDASSHLGMSVSWLRKCRSCGTGPKYHKFGDSVRYSKLDLENYILNSQISFTGEA